MILMLRVPVFLAHGILPYQIPAPLMVLVPLLQPFCDGQRQGAPLLALPVIIPGKIQVRLSARYCAQLAPLLGQALLHGLHLGAIG